MTGAQGDRGPVLGPVGSSGLIASSPSSNASCSALTASGTRSAEITQEILIGEVEIISMLIPSPPSTSKTLAATPGCERMPAPTIETLPIRSSVFTPWLSSPRPAIVSVAVGQVGAVDGEGEVGELVVADGLVLDDHVDVDVGVGQRGEDPPGDAGLVADAGQRHARLVVGVGHGCYEWLLHGFLSSLNDEGTGAVLEAAAAVDADAVVARVLDRAQLQDLRPRGRHLEHLLVGDGRQLARVGDDPRVGAEDAGDVGVDLADLGVEGGGEGDRGRVGAAAAERGDVAAVGRDALEAGDEDDPVLARAPRGCGRRGRR